MPKRLGTTELKHLPGIGLCQQIISSLRGPGINLGREDAADRRGGCWRYPPPRQEGGGSRLGLGSCRPVFTPAPRPLAQPPAPPFCQRAVSKRSHGLAPHQEFPRELLENGFQGHGAGDRERVAWVSCLYGQSALQSLEASPHTDSRVGQTRGPHSPVGPSLL